MAILTKERVLADIPAIERMAFANFEENITTLNLEYKESPSKMVRLKVLRVDGVSVYQFIQASGNTAHLNGSVAFLAKATNVTRDEFPNLFGDAAVRELDESDYEGMQVMVNGSVELSAYYDDMLENLKSVSFGVKMDRREIRGSISPTSKDTGSENPDPHPNPPTDDDKNPNPPKGCLWF